ncbi:uncharacterized protein LOC120334674 [Styela clava]
MLLFYTVILLVIGNYVTESANVELTLCPKVYCGPNARCVVRNGEQTCECDPDANRLPVFNECIADTKFYCEMIFYEAIMEEILNSAVETLQKKGVEKAISEITNRKKAISQCDSTKDNAAKIDKFVKSMTYSGQKIELGIIVFLRSIIDETQSKTDLSKVIKEIESDKKYTKNEKDLLKKLNELLGRKC